MVDYHKQLVSALENVLPTHYEMALTADTETPCISYQERNNYVSTFGDTLGYSRIIYTVKVWANDIADIQKYSMMIDDVLRPIGFKRTSANELYDVNSTMIQKVLTFEALAYETY